VPAAEIGGQGVKMVESLKSSSTLRYECDHCIQLQAYNKSNPGKALRLWSRIR
jgi:hypothetical protein